MLDSKTVSTPLEVGLKPTKASTEPEAGEMQKYQSAIGSLMYAMLGTRPDLAFAISVVNITQGQMRHIGLQQLASGVNLEHGLFRSLRSKWAT